MTQKKDRRYYRHLKKDLKRCGNKRIRQYHKKQILENPEEAHLADDYELGSLSTEYLNGMDNDPTRKRDSVDTVQDPLMDSKNWTSYE